MDALHTIYHNLQKGYSYGKDINYVRFPYFSEKLWKHNKYIHWWHYGSSANRNTLKELEWIITVIFKMTPDEFLNEYILNTESEYY